MATVLKIKRSAKNMARPNKKAWNRAIDKTNSFGYPPATTPWPAGSPGGGGSGNSEGWAFSITDGDTTFGTDFPPKAVDYSGHESKFNEVERPDRKPLLRRSGRALRKMTMTLLLLPKKPNQNDINASIDERLINLEKLAESRKPLTVEYDPRTRGDWKITSMTYSSIERVKGTSHISRAEVQLEFTEDPEPTKITINETTNKRPTKYTVKHGDTLQKIAVKFYQTDNARIVNAIAKANDIKNPKHIKVGRKIKLP